MALFTRLDKPAYAEIWMERYHKNDFSPSIKVKTRSGVIHTLGFFDDDGSLQLIKFDTAISPQFEGDILFDEGGFLDIRK